MDDCSTDNSKEIIESYRGHEKIKHIEYNKTNSGSTFKQWKKGIELAKGEWIWIAESDDVADENFIGNLLKNAITSNSQIVYCNSQIIDEYSNLAKAYGNSNVPNKETHSYFNQDFILPSKLFLENWMLTDNFITNASAVIFSSEILKRDLAVFDKTSNMKLMGDWYFWLNYLLNCSGISYMNQPLNYFRNHSGNVRSTKMIHRILEFDSILELLKQNEVPLKATIQTYLYRYLDKEYFSKLNIVQHLKVLGISFHYSFHFLYFKSILKFLFTNTVVR